MAAVFEYRGLWPVVVIINVSRSVGPEFGPEDLNCMRHGGGSQIRAADHVSARTAVATLLPQTARQPSVYTLRDRNGCARV